MFCSVTNALGSVSCLASSFLMFPLISSLTGANAVDPRTSRKGKILEHDERNGLVGMPLSASSWMFSKRDFAAVKKVSGSSFISSEFKLDD